MPDVTDFIFLSESAKLFPGRPHYNTLRRWAVRGSSGEILETWIIGNRPVTTREAINDFIRRRTEKARRERGAPSEMDQSEADLDAMGV